MGARLHHVCTFSSSVCNKKHVNRMIVRMKLVARGNESSDNPPTLNLPGCRKPLAVVCVRDRCWTPSCRWTVCTRCSNLRANLSFFFFSFLFFFPPRIAPRRHEDTFSSPKDRPPLIGRRQSVVVLNRILQCGDLQRGSWKLDRSTVARQIRLRLEETRFLRSDGTRRARDD